MTEVTTIKILKETKARLDKLKEHKKESYEEVLRKILNILNICRKNPEKARGILMHIDSVIKRKRPVRLKPFIKPNLNNIRH